MTRCGAIAVLLLAAVPAAAAPHRVASLNLCTDQLLVALADPADIASLSPLARDPDLSLAAEAARHLPDNGGSAEEILRERADLVLAEPGGAGPTMALLKRLGVRVETIEMVDRLDRIAPAIRQVAALLGRDAAGEALAARLAASLASLPPPPDHRPVALLYEANGWSVGAGTLGDDVLVAAGFANAATAMGVAGYGPVALERIVAAPPDLLVTERSEAGGASLAATWLDHPALRRAVARRVEIPAPLLMCGTPAIGDAIRGLADAR